MKSYKESVGAPIIGKQTLLEAIEKKRARSAWDKGVKAYACDLLCEFDCDTNCARLTERDLLGGASDWHQYSWGGCACCYNHQICAALCTPFEQKRTKNGVLPPNSHEDWLDVQARALYQASALILQTITELCHFDNRANSTAQETLKRRIEAQERRIHSTERDIEAVSMEIGNIRQLLKGTLTYRDNAKKQLARKKYYLRRLEHELDALSADCGEFLADNMTA